MEARNYKELLVWQKSMRLVETVYVLVREFPREEIYGLTSQNELFIESEQLLDEIMRMLNRLIAVLEAEKVA